MGTSNNNQIKRRRVSGRAFQGSQAPRDGRYRCSLSGLTGFTASLPPGFPCIIMFLVPNLSRSKRKGLSRQPNPLIFWRRGEDLNLRWSFPHTHFPGVLLKPYSDTSPQEGSA